MFFNALARRIVAVVTLFAIFMVILFGMPFANGHIARAAGNTWIVTSTADDLSSNCSASTFTGTNCELRDAINQAAAGDTIIFSATGIITLGSAGTLTLGKNLTIIGPGAASLAIDGNHAATVLTVSSGSTVSLGGLTIQHGNATTGNGGGVLNNGQALTISNSIFSNNGAVEGGGIYNLGGTVTINNSLFSGNGAGYGGVVWNDLLGTLTISNSTLSGNSAGYAGSIDNVGILTVTNSTFSGNSANSGGAIDNVSSGTMTISNSTISGNSANYVGGGDGGGIRNQSTLNLLSDIIAKNTATGAGQDVFTTNLGTSTSVGYNLIGDGTGSNITAATGDQIGTSASPIDPKLAILANNGGSTQTMALLPGSPAYEKGFCGGNNTVTPVAPAVTTDQRGQPRKGTTIGCDVGAYEVQPSIDTIGIYRAGMFYLRLHNSTGNADLTVAFTAGTKPYPIVGDWTGSGFDTVGVYDQSNGKFSLRNTNAPGLPDEQFVLGNPNDQPLSGRWLISATNAGVGVFRPSNGLIYLKNALTTGYADYTMVLGIPGDTGLAGDWNGKGFDSPGVYRRSNSYFYLSNQVKNGSVIGDYQLQYGIGGDSPVVGDWIAQGHDGVGLFRQSNGFTYLKNTLVTGYADNAFTYGIAGDVPVAGHWQLTYPPVVQKPSPQAPAPPVLIAKTALPQLPNSSVEGSNQIGG